MTREHLPRHMADWSKRCPGCWLHATLCLCDQFDPIALNHTRVVIVMDERESRQTTNTSHLAPLTVTPAEIRVRSRHDHDGDSVAGLADPNRRIWMLYPSPHARTLTPDDRPERSADTRPISLIVPDGTWRSTSRMIRRVPWLRGLERVQLPPGPPARRWLRRPPTTHALPTLEALARALEILEGPAPARLMARALDVMFDRHLWSKGQLPAERVAGGVPEAALARRRPQRPRPSRSADGRSGGCEQAGPVSSFPPE